MQENFLKKALDLAQKAVGFTSPNPCVGAVVVKKNKIIGRGYHKKAGGKHAEVLAIENANKNGFSVEGSDLYVTLEPCAMCMYAILLHRLAGVIYGAPSPVFGYQLDKQGFDPLYKYDALRIVSGVMQEESAQLLKKFFTGKRHKYGK